MQPTLFGEPARLVKVHTCTQACEAYPDGSGGVEPDHVHLPTFALKSKDPASHTAEVYVYERYVNEDGSWSEDFRKEHPWFFDTAHKTYRGPVAARVD